MKIQTDIHAGLTEDNILAGLEGAAASAAQWVGAGAQLLESNLISWVTTPQIQAGLDRAFWYPMLPPL